MSYQTNFKVTVRADEVNLYIGEDSPKPDITLTGPCGMAIIVLRIADNLGVSQDELLAAMQK